MKNITLVALLVLGSCQTKDDGSSKQEQKTSDTTLSKPTNTSKEVEAIYINCILYTNLHNFYFKSINKGDTIEVQIPVVEDPGNITIAKMPEKMIDDSPDLEGLPGGHPNMLGKKFRLIYNEKNEVKEVLLAQ